MYSLRAVLNDCLCSSETVVEGIVSVEGAWISPVQPTMSCSWVVESERMPEIMAAWPYRGARDHSESDFSGTSIGDGGVDESEPSAVGGVSGGVGTVAVWSGFELRVAIIGR